MSAPEPAVNRRLVVQRDDGVPALVPPAALEALSFTAIGLLSYLTSCSQPPTRAQLLDSSPADVPDEIDRAIGELIAAGFITHDLRVAMGNA